MNSISTVLLLSCLLTTGQLLSIIDHTSKAIGLGHIVIEYGPVRPVPIAVIDTRRVENGLIPLPELFGFVRRYLRNRGYPTILTRHFFLWHDGRELDRNASDIDMLSVDTNEQSLGSRSARSSKRMTTTLRLQYPDGAFRRRMPYIFCCKNTKIASFVTSNELEIEFDLKLHSDIL